MRPFRFGGGPAAAPDWLRAPGLLLRLILLPVFCVLLAAGCASPGPPRAPSLQIPEPVRDLSAAREGDAVVLRFTLPERTTDGAGLRPPTVLATLCRGAGRDPCTPVSGFEGVRLSAASQADGKAPIVTWRDALPIALTNGDARVLRYQVRLANITGHSSDESNPAFALAGAAPPRVEGLKAEGTRNGVLLEWAATPAAGAEVLIHREVVGAADKVASKRKDAAGVWLKANAGAAEGANSARTLDGSAEKDVAYRYSAVRRRVVQIDAHTLEMRGLPSAQVLFTLHDVFPPPAPRGLAAAAFGQGVGFAVDLIWEPVEDARLAGYNVTRQAVDADGNATGAAMKLNAAPVPLPAFHDTTADATQRYRYSVTAVDAKGNESSAVTAMLIPAQP